MSLSFDNAALIDRVWPRWLIDCDAVSTTSDELYRLLDAAREEGYERGYAKGYAEGHDAGEEAGWNLSRDCEAD